MEQENLYLLLNQNEPFRIQILDGYVLVKQEQEQRVPISKKRGVILCSILKDAPKTMQRICSFSDGELEISSNDRFMRSIKKINGRYDLYETNSYLAFVKK